MRNSKGQFLKGHRINNGRTTWNKGIRTGLIPRSVFKKGNNIGIKNHEWKGDNVGYSVLHRWVKRWLGRPNKCDYKNCIYPRTNTRGVTYEAPKRFHWANISGEYKRDLTDWIKLCVSCHKLYDGGKIIL